jgi:DNA-3-methyladenine glycosylase
MILGRDFYAQDAPVVARALLGATLARRIDGQRVSGRIIETEAYSGLDDLASHGRAKQTPRNLPMWDAPGHAYVYLIYGMYWLLNVVCEPVGQPAAVLIRAIEPLKGQSIMAANRPGHPQKNWTKGPGRLTMALAITGADNCADMTSQKAGLWIEAGDPVPDEAVRAGPRIGLGRHVTDPWLTIPWRWWVAGNSYVSK